MLGETKRDRVAERRAATRREILDAAWAQAREVGIANITLRDIAREVGMQPPSLYSHFDSKNAVYDAMYAEAWAEYEAHALAQLDDVPAHPRAAIHRAGRVFFDFAVADFDIWISLIGGLIDQQLANDPGGDRFSRLLERAIDMFADAVGMPPLPQKHPTRRKAGTPR